MIGYAQLRSGRGFQFCCALPDYTQRTAALFGARRSGSRVIAALIRLRQEGSVTEPHTGRAGAAMEWDGFVLLRTFFAPAVMEGMLAFFRGRKLIAPDGHLAALKDLPLSTGMAADPLSTVDACPGPMEAINAPDILQVASNYIGYEPAIASLDVRWSFPAALRPTDMQLFQRDPNDWRFPTLLVGLIDVDASSSQHAYRAGSHGRAAALRAQHYLREALESWYGQRPDDHRVAQRQSPGRCPRYPHGPAAAAGAAPGLTGAVLTSANLRLPPRPRRGGNRPRHLRQPPADPLKRRVSGALSGTGRPAEPGLGISPAGNACIGR
jgi:hypothetical protein